MKKYIDKIVMYLDALLEVWEEYIWKNRNTKMEVVYQDKEISFKLYDDREVIDDMALTFNEKEIELYKYIVLRVFIALFGKVVIHNEGDIFYNIIHKPYLKLLVSNMEVKEMLLKVKELQMSEVLNRNTGMVVEAYNRVLPSLSSVCFAKKVKKRVFVSSQMLRGEVF